MKIVNRVYRFFIPQDDPYVVRRKYGIPNRLNLKIEFKDGWFIATSPEMPGLITEARDGEEMLDNVNDAVLSYFDVPKREADIVFNEMNIDGLGRFSYDKKKSLQAA